ncbi:YciI-like protein [Mesorhizobium sp. CAU 1732]|uniref:YciI-like protein n=1 Tax=Mesorhizobium sp. CAU 1732 TaxID=3140358 RepID=UPI003260CA4B
MLFTIICKDKPGNLEVRMANRPAHLEYLTALNAAGTLKFAGPFLGDDGKPIGSLVAVEAETLDAAKAIGAGDPYAKADLFASVEVLPWNWTFNAPEAK